ncbi:hypothetical protein JIX56_45665 [Streptomyces sp. CA-210063]|uniref:hypothetical protein n=1 Tax=Streptomyces sp. CA-210063 TaxID=2801029 RepID=UPI00214AAC36|nr:hypothetical protein [Streptomyces sp. CA-210063]UUU36527.1 hypothetical protein JIX56_45665 [Streptomyces sp. CA-210063]
MSRSRLAHGSLTSLAAALALLAAGCSGTADGAGGCRENGGWSAKDRAEWLRPTVSFPEAAAEVNAADKDPAVLIRPRDRDDGGPLCEPVTVHVEFWELTARTAGTEMTSVLSYRLATDGTEERAIGFPPGLSAGKRGACIGVLMAAYSGARLAETELPEDVGRSASTGTADVEFRTDRIGAYRLLPPSDPERCDADGGPTTSPPATPMPWGSDHP